MISNVPYPKYVGFIVNGITFFVLPALWIKSESQSIANDVQQSVSVQYAPAITYSSTSYTIRIEIPQGNILTNAALRTLKAVIKMSSETLASSGEAYSNIDYTQAIEPSEVGRIISPWRKRDDPLNDTEVRNTSKFNDYMEDGRRAMVTGYIGISHQCLGGYITHFSSDLRVASMIEDWTISLEAINLSVIRQGPPDPPEQPSVPTSSPNDIPSHGIDNDLIKKE